MEFETIDDSQNTLPPEVAVEIKGMTKWMSFTSVLLIIFGILSILGNLNTLAQQGSPSIILGIITNGISIYLSFMVIKSSSLFNSFADSHNEDSLIEALKITKMYWMVSVLIIVVSIVLSFATGGM
jgi:accessory gene regulator protein AgrB